MTQPLRMRTQLASYKKKAEILRQIHSNKQKRFKWYGSVSLYGSIALSILATFLGFMDANALASVSPWQLSTVQFELARQGSLLLLLIAVTLAAAARFDESRNQHHRSIVALTGLLRDLDDEMHRLRDVDEVPPGTIDAYRERYKMITEFLPPSSDREYQRSKRDYAEKKRHATRAERGRARVARWIPRAVKGRSDFAGSLIADPSQIVEEILSDDPVVLRALKAIDDVGPPDWWLTGGAIRTTVWSELTGRQGSIDDFDVVYFDQDADAATDDDIEDYLSHEVPDVRWDVKNQARMHVRHGDDAYTSATDAISKFPETATAWAVRLEDSGSLKVFAPHGLDDLLRMVVRPTPHARKGHLEEFIGRVKKKRWNEEWPEAVIADVTLRYAKSE